MLLICCVVKPYLLIECRGFTYLHYNFYNNYYIHYKCYTVYQLLTISTIPTIPTHSKLLVSCSKMSYVNFFSNLALIKNNQPLQWHKQRHSTMFRIWFLLRIMKETVLCPRFTQNLYIDINCELQYCQIELCEV